MRCSHEVSEQKVWERIQNGVMKPHPYCRKCGALKNISSDRAKSLGHFLRALSEIRRCVERRGQKISEAQIRLIMKELIENDFDDLWSMSYTAQKNLFKSVVRKYVRIPEDLVERFL